MPPVKVEVPEPKTVMVEVAVRGPVFNAPVIIPSPSTENKRAGVPVPTPKNPDGERVSKLALLESRILKMGTN